MRVKNEILWSGAGFCSRADGEYEEAIVQPGYAMLFRIDAVDGRKKLRLLGELPFKQTIKAVGVQ